MRAETPVTSDGIPEAVPSRHRRRLLLPALAAAALVLALTAAFATADALRAAREVRAGRAAFVALARDGFDDYGRSAARADAGARRFAAADRIAARSVWLSAWARLPVLGRPARWLQAATRSTASLSDRAAAFLERIEPRMSAIGDPASGLAALRVVEREVDALRRAVDRVRLPSTGGFFPPANSASRELSSDLERLSDSLRDASAVSRGLASFLAGPTTYAVLAANNAEMRAGGMVLQIGRLQSAAGRMTVGGFRSTAELGLHDPVAIPAEIRALYGWLRPDVEWRNVGSSANFPAVGPVYAAMAETSGLGRVDGVLHIDVPALRALMEVTGPVTAGGRRYDASNVERLVMHELYLAYANEQPERRREFAQLAAATFAALNERGWRPADLARALGSAVSGRHLLAWSRRPAEQTGWASLKVDGALERDGLMLTVQNHVGNKLDWFLRPSVALRVEQRPGGWRRVRVRITIVNPARPGPAGYVQGDGSIVPPSAHRALVAVYLPGWATNVEMPGRPIALVGPDGPMRVIGTRIDIPAKGTESLEVAFSIPPDMHRIVILPSARAHPVPIVVAGRRLDDAFRRIVAI